MLEGIKFPFLRGTVTMCPACYSAALLMLAGIATTTVSGTTAFVVGRQLRREAKLEKLKEEAKK